MGATMWGAENASASERTARKALAGGMAAFVVEMLTYPLTVAHTRLTSDMAKDGSRAYKGLADCCVRTVKTEGVGAMYRGLGVSLTGIIPFYAVSFPLFEALSEAMPDGVCGRLAAGAVSSACAAVLVFPSDTVRRKLAVSGTQTGKRYRGTAHCIKHVYRKEGARGFYKGLGLQLMKVA